MRTRTCKKLYRITLVLIFCFSVWGCPSGGSGGGVQEVADNTSTEDEDTLSVAALATDLETFDSCEQLEVYLKEQAILEMEEQVDAYAESDSDSILTAAPDEGIDYSTTNVQVEGVDEADFVKNDGDYIYLLSNGNFIIYKARPGSETKELSRVAIEGSLLSMFVYDDTAVIFSSYSTTENCLDCPYYEYVKISILNIHDKESPEIIRELNVEGLYKSSRRIGNIVRVVVTSCKPDFGINYSPLAYNESDKSLEDAIEDSKQENRSRIQSASLSDWIPKYNEIVYSSGGEETLSGNLAECQNIYRPVDPTGHEILSILTIDLNDPTAHQRDISLVANVSHVYASENNLYVAVSPLQFDIMRRVMPETNNVKEFVKIHKFDIHSDPTKALYVASGEVEGYLLNQYSMDEYNGFLRVATTEGFGSNLTNNLFVLKEEQGKLNVVGEIREIAPTESIYSARFMGDRGYLVTFKKIDPLFTLDLADPYNPEIAGELKVPGYSEYIHPLGKNHLLAIGKDAEDMGSFAWYQGVQLSLFDVSDLSNPVQVDKVIIGSRGTESEALGDPKAFNYFPSQDLLAVPIALYEGGTGGSDWGDFSSIGIHLYRVTPEEGFEFLGMINHTEDGCLSGEHNDCDLYPRSQLRKSVIIDDTIFSISNLLMRVSDPEDLSQVVDPIVFSNVPVIITDQSPGAIEMAPFELQSIKVEGNYTTLNVNHAGGCKNHTYKLFMSPSSFAESFPPYANLYMQHDANGDTCEAMLSKNISFNLQSLSDLHEENYGIKGPIKLNVWNYKSDYKLEVIYDPSSSCGNNGCAPEQRGGGLFIGTPFTIAYQETLRNPDEGISLSFQSIKEESRCPQGVQCFWEGNASLQFTFSKNTESVAFELNTNDRFETKATVLSYTIELLDVVPYPRADVDYTSEDYKASILVSK